LKIIFARGSGQTGDEKARYGKLLLHNAGIGPISPLDDLRVEDWENMIDINIKGVLSGIAAAVAGVSQAGFRTFRQHRFYGRH